MHLRHLLGAAILATATHAPTRLFAQAPADSALVHRILIAEDARDTASPALAEGRAHPDTRIQWLAQRAYDRTVDSLFGARARQAARTRRVTWPLPEWRQRHDALRARRDDCGAMIAALSDSVIQVRLRALDLLRASCDTSTALRVPLTVRRLPPGRTNTILRHEAAHAYLAYARLWPTEARSILGEIASRPEWLLRMYAARAATLARDTATLTRLAADRNGNVQEAAIEGLAALTGHSSDEIYLRGLNSAGAQAVRAAAIALKGSTHARLTRDADRALRRWRARNNDSERDVIQALQTLLGRPTTEPPRRAGLVPAEAVALALGKEVRLRVTLDSASGGGSFVVLLRGDVAPITAARVAALARRGYYDGTSWHRVIADFVIQGGSPDDNEYVGYHSFFRDELETLSHLRGGVGMSTRGHDTGDAQWFIDLSDLQRLDRDYTLFGEVVEGMDVVDGILEGAGIRSIREITP
jgi:cyclophilin family peptidyl-prolyl cis-trans isomerase